MEIKTFDSKIFSMKGISKKTIDEHLKLYQGYVKKYNLINDQLKELTIEDCENVNQIYSNIRELKVELSFAWGGVFNHEMYFSHLGGQGVAPSVKILRQIKTDFGSYNKFIDDLKYTGLAARGWVWTAWNIQEKRLFNYLGDSQNTYAVWGAIPIIALDTYEHAYFIDYGVNRGQYIDSFIENLNWPVVEENFNIALKK